MIKMTTRKVWILLIVLLSVICLTSSAENLRRVPAQRAKPITYKGITFKPHFYTDAGVIEAFNAKTGKKVWETKVFDVKFNPWMEADVQWIDIISLRITETGELLVTDERGKDYRVQIPKEILIDDSVPPSKGISKERASEIAEQVCKEAGWPWSYDTKVTDEGDSWSFYTNPLQEGSNTYIKVDKKTGKVLEKTLIPI